jgi:drug/metabolite transporter (DMT)-like permease
MSLRHSMLAVLVMLIWGANFVVIDEGLSDVPPLLFLALRFVLVAFPLVFFVPRPKASWRAVVAVGAFMSLGQFSLLYIALDLGMPSGLASLVLQAQVIFTIVIAAVVLREPPTRRQVVAAPGHRDARWIPLLGDRQRGGPECRDLLGLLAGGLVGAGRADPGVPDVPGRGRS